MRWTTTIGAVLIALGLAFFVGMVFIQAIHLLAANWNEMNLSAKMLVATVATMVVGVIVLAIGEITG